MKFLNYSKIINNNVIHIFNFQEFRLNDNFFHHVLKKKTEELKNVLKNVKIIPGNMYRNKNDTF